MTNEIDQLKRQAKVSVVTDFVQMISIAIVVVYSFMEVFL